MGLSLLTLLFPLMCLPCAELKAPTISTTILLPSRADPGGVFDAPNEKCPPDRGSFDCVTGGRMFKFSPIRTPSSPNSKYADSIIYPPTPPSETEFDLSDDYISSSVSSNGSNSTRTIVSPQAIPARQRTSSSVRQLATPPLTPDDGDNDSIDDERKHTKNAFDFLLNIFPQNGAKALSYAKSVTISVPNMGDEFDGVVLELPGRPKALYVDGKSTQSVSLRESIVALMDLADECFYCSALIIALDRSSEALGDLLHSFMYVGGTVVTRPPFPTDPRYLLVGMEI